MSSAVETIGRITTRRATIPSRRWYWVAVAIAFLGLGLGVGWGVLGTLQTRDTAAALPRTTAPGTLEIAVSGGTSRLIYFEGEGRPGPEALGLAVTAPDGSPVAVEPYDLILKYEVAGWAGAPIASFSTPDDGIYVVAANGLAANGEFSVGGNVVRTQALAILEALAIIHASFVCGVVLIVVVSVRRSARSGSSGRHPAPAV